MDRASSIQARLDALKILHDNGIATVLFLSPIFPYITDCRKIIECSHTFIDEFWFENLNLRGSYKPVILSYIRSKYPQYADCYRRIYTQNDNYYWRALAHKLASYCREQHIRYKLYFNHAVLVQKKKNGQ
ncbi:MAG: hypothetical protein LKF96_08815 [Treponema sp.]|jgi:DNA repair photolyase|nr:hypothetical protein [Treponema sp.]